MKKGTALWHLSSEESKLRPVHLTTPNFSYLKIKALYSLVSSGTERLVAQGRVPDDLKESMRVPGQEGSFQFPIKYGYSLVGEVLNENHPLQGKVVHLLHPHQDICMVEESAVSVVPESVPAQRATLASNLETAINAVWDAEVSIGDKVLIAGFGIIGALVAEVLREVPGVDIYLLEKNDGRRKMAKELGWKIWKGKEEGDFDIAFHTTGNQNALQVCVENVGFGGRIMELSWYGNQSVQLNLGGSFHSQRKQIISSQVGRLPLTKRDRWDFKRRKALVFRLLQVTNYDRLITTLIPFTESPIFFNKLRNGSLEGLGVCIKY